MPNRYANLTGTNRISEEYDLINDGFDAVQDDVDDLASDVQAAQDDVATLEQRVDNIVSQSGDDITEIVDARQPATGSAYPVLKARLDAADEQLADTSQQADEIVTVGLDGDYASINDALVYFGKKHICYKKDGFIAEIKLLSGFVMQEQVLLDAVDLSFVRIISVDSEVVISRQHLVVSPELAYESYPAFGAVNQAKLPVIAALFSMDNTGVAEFRVGILVRQSSTALIMPSCGVKNAGGDGLLVGECSTVNAYAAIFTNSGRNNVRVFHSSAINVRSSILTGAKAHGIHASDSAIVSAHNADCSDAEGTGIWAESVSQVTFQEGKANGCGGNALEAVSGSYIAARDGSFKNAGMDGISAIIGGSISAQRSDFSGAARDGCHAERGSSVSADGADFSNAGRHGIYSGNGSNVNANGATCSNSVDHAVYARDNSCIDFQSGVANFSGENAIVAYDGSTVNARSVTANNASNDGVLSQHGSMVNVRESQIKDAGRFGLNAFSSSINARNTNVTGAKNTNQITVDAGAIIHAAGAIGTLRQPANVPTSQGLIFQ